MISRFANVMAVVAAVSMLALAGCGGGGGESGSGYSGNTAPTVLTASNAAAMSVDAMDAVDGISSLEGVAKNVAVVDSRQNGLQFLPLSGILERSFSKVSGKPILAKTVAETISETVYGFSGSFHYAASANTSTGNVSATITFDGYQEDAYAQTISGSVSMSGKVDLQTGSTTRLIIVISSLQISDDSDSGTVKGTMTIVNGTVQTVTMSLVLRDDLSNSTYWFKDFRMVVGAETTTISGTYYHPVHGYVVIATLIPLANYTYLGMPDSGQVLFTGSNGSKVLLTYTGSGPGYDLDLDAYGTGNYLPL